MAVYLQGSFALGDADEHSDVDWIAVTEADPTAEELAALQSMHQRLYRRTTPWAQHLEGSYLTRALIRRIDPERRPVWFLDNGSEELVQDNHCNTAVVRWTVRERGVPLVGPDPKELVDPVSAGRSPRGRRHRHGRMGRLAERAPRHQPTRSEPRRRLVLPDPADDRDGNRHLEAGGRRVGARRPARGMVRVDSRRAGRSAGPVDQGPPAGRSGGLRADPRVRDYALSRPRPFRP